MRPSTGLVGALLFGSGLAALVYQTAWQRMFRLVFGASTGASAAVLGIFLAGLGVGGWWLGRRAERSKRPLEFYGNLEVGVALCAAATPVLVDGVGRAYVALGGSSSLGTTGATVVRLLLATLVMGPSVVLMGGTLPAAARAVEVDDDAARGRLATLYAVNTAGAVCGALLATFLFFEVFGTRLTLWVAVLLNLLVAIVARARGRAAPDVPVGPAEDPPMPREPAPGPRAAHVPAAFVYSAAGIVGFAFLYLELVWYRMLSPLLGGSTFTFGLILAVALAGIGLGGWTYSRRGHDRPATLGLLAVTVGLEALAVGVPLALGDSIALHTAFARGAGSLGFGALVFVWGAVASAVILPAAIVAGYQFPVLFALLGRGREGVAKQVGLAYAFNTVGSIAGSVLAGFYLVPKLGAVGSWRAVVFLLVALALAAIVASYRFEGRAAARSLALAALAAGVSAWCATARGPTAVWRHSAIGAGRADVSSADKNGLRFWRSTMNDRMLWERDGVESAIGLSTTGGIAFIVNGKSDGAVINDRATQTMLGMLPALLHPDPKNVFVLGLGTGMSAGWVGSVAGVERVDVAELEPAIVEVARLASKANRDVLSNPKVHVFLGDGREWLLTTRHTYDVIVSEPSNPYRAGIASLFTEEFYETVAGRLAPDGVFGQWVQAYEVDTTTVRIVLRTMRAVFPVVEAWQTQGGDFLFVGSRQERTLDVAALRRRIAEEPYASALPRTWLVGDAEGVLSHFVATSEVVADIAEAIDVPINRDDTNVLEFAFARSLGIEGIDGVADLLAVAAARRADRPRVAGEVDWERFEQVRGRAWHISGGEMPQGLGFSTQVARDRAVAFQAGCLGRIDAVLASWDGEPRDVVERHVLALAHAHAGDEVALESAARLQEAGFSAEAGLVRARYFAKQKQPDRAVESLLGAIRDLREEALPLCNTTRQVLEVLGSLASRNPDLARRGAEALIAGPLAVYAADDVRLDVQERLAFASLDATLCVRALESHLTAPLWQRGLLTDRLACLERAQHPLAEQAARDLEAYLAATAGSFAAGLDGVAPPTLGPPPKPAGSAGPLPSGSAHEAPAPSASVAPAGSGPAPPGSASAGPSGSAAP